MILADTSIWINHLRRADATLVRLLHEEHVVAHPFVLGELALGGLRRTDEVYQSLSRLRSVLTASHNEVIAFVEYARLGGSGIGYVDACLLASVQITGDTWLWTRDRRLDAVADRLGLAARPGRP